MTAIDLTIDDWDKPDEMVGRGGIPAPGKYHCQVTDVKMENNQIELHFEISGPGSECGKTFREWLQMSGNTDETTKKIRGRLGVFACRLGLVSDTDWQAAKEQGIPLSFDFADAIGNQAIVELKEETNEGKTRIRVPWAGIHRLDSEEAKGVPLDPELAELGGYHGGNGTQGQGDNVAEAPQAQAQVTAQASQQPTAPVATAGNKPDEEFDF